ncbi:Crp/Fnr family transcriptional regulator [Mucilaginibacter sp. AW1-7]|uniref:Crp/Fnr family transcriptional regulator n=1 Tax=Mucilaginibacter sp. AW1-7 TaxID=3349874 RepID=UPI003F734A73
MDTELIMQTVNHISPVSDAVKIRLKEYLKEERFPKKYQLLQEGQTAKKIYFIKEGFARAFYYTADGKECTAWFMGTGEFMISVFSFFTQKPAAENIELLEDSTLQSITWAQLQTLYKEFTEFNLIGRIITEKYYIESEKKSILLRTLTAKERYQQLVKSNPDILQKASLSQIASFIGITLETLSRLRGKRAH